METIREYMEVTKGLYIESFNIQGLWGYKNLHWENINPDVNILVGINGSGKTTLLNIMNAYYNNDAKDLKKYQGTFTGNPKIGETYTIAYLRSFDNPVTDKRKGESLLMQELNNVVFQNKEGISFFNYRMKMLDYPTQANTIQANIDELFETINSFFKETNKTIDISKGNNSSLIFKKDGYNISLEQLSAGEKQLMLILLKVFLLEKKPAIVFMDEPEISLHIRWQREIIDAIRKLNPNTQLFIATHSPSIFGAGWGDKIIYMDDLIK